MKTEVITSYFFLFLQIAISNAELSYRNPRVTNNERRRNNGMSMYREGYIGETPVEILKTPNFDVMLLDEKTSGPMWKKYLDIFPPKDLRNVPQIEVNYGGEISTIVEGTRRPSIRLDRSEVESVLASLGGRDHILVLLPRNCKLHSTEINKNYLDDFENEFLPKLLQQLHKKSGVQNLGGDMVDPVIDRILQILDKDEEKMLNDLRKKFEEPKFVTGSSMYNSGYTTNRRSDADGKYKRPKVNTPKQTQIRNNLYKDPCNEGYVFLLQNNKNSLDPDSLNDILLRVMKVVTEAN